MRKTIYTMAVAALVVCGCDEPKPPPAPRTEYAFFELPPLGKDQEYTVAYWHESAGRPRRCRDGASLLQELSDHGWVFVGNMGTTVMVQSNPGQGHLPGWGARFTVSRDLTAEAMAELKDRPRN